jgi:hypothetical protein
MRYSCTGLLSFEGLTKSVAPNFFAHSSLPSFVSIAIILDAPLATHPWITLRPTQPAPKMAHVEPFSTLAVRVAAPNPVVIPQPKRQALSRGAFGLMATIEISATTIRQNGLGWDCLCIGRMSRYPCNEGYPSHGHGSGLCHRASGLCLGWHEFCHTSLSFHSIYQPFATRGPDLAELAFPTFRGVERYNVVSNLDVGDAFTHGLDNPTSFMPADYGKRSLRVFPRKSISIGMTDLLSVSMVL